MNFRELVAVVVLGASALSSGACTFWAPHSLVPSDRPIREAVLVGKRVDGQVCNRYILGFIPIDGNAPVEQLMQQFHDAAPQAVAFQDLRFDQSFTYYFVWTELCLIGSAEPVVPVVKIPRRAAAAPAPGEDLPMQPRPPIASPPPAPDTGKEKTPEEIEQEMLGGPK